MKMNRNLFAHVLRMSPLVVTTVVLVAIAVSSGPLASSAQQAPPAANAAPTPNIGGAIVLAADFANALKSWTAPDAATLHSSSGGGSETWYQPCTSGNVDFAATGGWCWVPELKLFYNINSRTLLDPFSHRLMVVDAAHTGLQEVIRADDEDLEPPTFMVRARTTPAPLSLKCVPGQAGLIGQHVSGLRTNAAHTDSPTMRARFTAEAEWWTKICA
jgi:hypothetical protein